jgi:PAT family beta-lactamase induction signal transducer AmpG
VFWAIGNPAGCRQTVESRRLAPLFPLAAAPVLQFNEHGLGGLPSRPNPMSAHQRTCCNPWVWIPTLYLAQGLPFAVVNFVSVIMYKSLGISNADIAFYTAWLYLPWVIKPLWSPVVDILRTRRWWIWGSQLLLGAGFATVGLSLPLPVFFQTSLVFFYLVAFSSATHDIAADGFYMLALNEKQQSFFVGIRSTFFRISMITGQGLLVILAGYTQTHTGLPMVELQVAVKPGVALVQKIEPATSLITALEGEVLIVVDPTALQLSPEPRRQPEVSALIAWARSNNTQNAFYKIEAKTVADASSPPWWKKFVLRPISGFLSRMGGFLGSPFRAFSHWLEPILRERFSPEPKIKDDIAGNLAVVAMHLSRPPGREILVTPAFKSGDRSVSLAEGARLVFNDQNWNQTALAVIQLDPKLRLPPAPSSSCAPATFPCPGPPRSECWWVCFCFLASTTNSFCPIPPATNRVTPTTSPRSLRSSSKPSAPSSPRTASASCFCSCCSTASAKPNW